MGSSPVRVTNEKDRQNACPFRCVLPSGESIGSREPLKTATPCPNGQIPVRIDLNPSGSENHVRDFL